jgi:hypothetical protein
MPRLAVDMIVLNGEEVLDRCLLPLRGTLDELIVVDTGSEDRTLPTLEGITGELGAYLRYERLHPLGPGFFTDSDETFNGASAISGRGGERLPGPFTFRRICADFAEARNRALLATSADYVLKLDADDEIASGAANLPRVLDHLDACDDIDIVASPYTIDGPEQVPARIEIADRLWRRASGLFWRQPIHEYLAGKRPERTHFLSSGLDIHDRKDSPGPGVRVPLRNLKILLWAEICGKAPVRSCTAESILFDFTLGHEAAEILPLYARSRLNGVPGRLDAKADSQLVSDCYYHLGRTFEAAHDPVSAFERYMAADDACPHLQALLRAHAMSGISEGRRKEAKDRLAKALGGQKRFGEGHRIINCDLGLLDRFLKSVYPHGSLLEEGTKCR